MRECNVPDVHIVGATNLKIRDRDRTGKASVRRDQHASDVIILGVPWRWEQHPRSMGFWGFFFFFWGTPGVGKSIQSPGDSGGFFFCVFLGAHGVGKGIQSPWDSGVSLGHNIQIDHVAIGVI